MRNPIPSESDLTIFEEIDPQQVSHCVILQRYLIGHRVDHFLTFYDLYMFSRCADIVTATELHPKILDHCFFYSSTKVFSLKPLPQQNEHSFMWTQSCHKRSRICCRNSSLFLIILKYSAFFILCFRTSMQKAWSYSCQLVEFRSALLSSNFFTGLLSCFSTYTIGVGCFSFSASISSSTLYQLFCRQSLSSLFLTASSLLILEEDIFTLIKCFISLNGSFCIEYIIQPLCSFISQSLSFLSAKTCYRSKGTNPIHATLSLPLIAIRQIAKDFACLDEQVSYMFSSTVQEMDFAQNSISECNTGSLSFFLMTNWMRHSLKGTLACRCLILIYFRGIIIYNKQLSNGF